jgi:hypothetical protein
MFDIFPDIDYDGLTKMMKETDNLFTYKSGPANLPPSKEDIDNMNNEKAHNSFMNELNDLFYRYGVTLNFYNLEDFKRHVIIENKKFNIDIEDELSQFSIDRSIKYAYIPDYKSFARVEMFISKNNPNNRYFNIKEVFYLSQQDRDKNKPEKVEKYFIKNKKLIKFVDTHKEAYDAVTKYGEEFFYNYDSKNFC